MHQKKIGLLGGTFDPIHHGHILIANYALNHLNLNSVELIPCFQSPHRSLPIANTKDRIKMIELAITPYPKLKINTLEIQNKTISYTIDTLKILTEKNPSIKYYYILGADVYEKFSTWKNSDEILQLVSLVVINRNKVRIKKNHGSVLFLNINPILISATNIRNKIKMGEKNIAELDPCVENYIKKHDLYLAAGAKLK